MSLWSMLRQRLGSPAAKSNHTLISETAEAVAAQLQLIIDAIPMAVLYIDRDFRYRFVNSTYAQWRGLDQNKFFGKHLSEVADKVAYETSVPYLEQCLRGEVTKYPIETQFVDKKRSISTICIPDFDKEKNVRGIIGILTDVTDQKATENMLRLAKETADSANAAKTAFLANMSHEIRTPLGVVMGFSDLLANEDLPKLQKQHFGEVIKRNGDLLSQVINDILDLSKVEAGKLDMDIRNVQLDEVLSDLHTILNLQAKEKGLDLKIILEDNLPTHIKTDSLRLRQIFLNVVGNGIKFTCKGKVEVHIYRSTVAPSLLCFTVTDTGTGISPQHAKNLFQPFSQGDSSTKRAYGGTGLGLSLSKKLARLLGGDVVLDHSEVGKGSSFTISIDLEIDEKADAKNPGMNEQPTISTGTEDNIRLDGRKILLVEDMPDNQVLVSQLLGLAGATVDTVSNGALALERVKKKSYDLMLMDLQMPIMDGYEATAKLRKAGNKIPIIALSAHALKGEKQRCLDYGFNTHISKPIDRSVLLKTVANYT